MVKLTKIYTRGGDKGKTSLGDGSRVSKHHDRIEAIGTVDEVNSTIGLIRLNVDQNIDKDLSHIQNDLFDLGADLCTPVIKKVNDEEECCELRIIPEQVTWLEKQIDTLNKDLDPLNSFILPGGSIASAHIHMARTIARRAERLIVRLQESESLNEEVVKYLNRLSDYLFVLARYLNNKGKNDILWVPGEHRK